MKKQIKSKTFLLSSIFFLLLITLGSKTNNIQSIDLFSDQDTSKEAQYKQKILEQSKKIDKIDQKVDSAQIKWDAIEKALKEKQQPK